MVAWDWERLEEAVSMKYCIESDTGIVLSQTVEWPTNPWHATQIDQELC